jgi:alkylated DNA repair dioxygenase AlkB
MFIDSQFLTDTAAGGLLTELETHVDAFRRPTLVLYGKTIQIPRSQCAFGTGTYHYSNIAVAATPAPPSMARFLETVQGLTGDDAFRFALVNRYEGGTQKIGRHADDEKDLVAGAPIVSYSLGVSRRFVVRPKKCLPGATRKERDQQLQSKAPAGPSALDPLFAPSECSGIPPGRTDLHHLSYARISFEVTAAHNMMVAMCGAFQREFVHEVPAEKSVVGVRYNITVRATEEKNSTGSACPHSSPKVNIP